MYNFYYEFDHGVTYDGAALCASLDHTLIDVTNILQVDTSKKT